MRGNVDAKITGNKVTGKGPIDYIAQNGIVVPGAPRRSTGRGQHDEPELLHPAGDQRGHRNPRLYAGGTITIDRKNTLSGNEVNILNSESTIGGKKYTPAPRGPGRVRNTNP